MSESIGELIVRRVKTGMENGHKPGDISDAVDRIFGSAILPLLSVRKCTECCAEVNELEYFRCLECPKLFCRGCAGKHFSLHTGVSSASLDELNTRLGAERETRVSLEKELEGIRAQLKDLEELADAIRNQRDAYARELAGLKAGVQQIRNSNDLYAKDNRELLERLRAEPGTKQNPIPMFIHCPRSECRREHIDKDEWATRPHRTHRCEYCGYEWEPPRLYTVGVLSLPEQKKPKITGATS